MDCISRESGRISVSEAAKLLGVSPQFIRIGMQRGTLPIAGEVCAALEERGELSAQNLVEISRPEDAPLHEEFEWDNDVAAELWRTKQAQTLIAHIAIKAETPAPVRAFFNIEVKSPVYENLNAIVRNEDKYSALLQTALRELESFQRKYAMLAELGKVMQAIEEAKMPPVRQHRRQAEKVLITNQQKGQGECNTDGHKKQSAKSDSPVHPGKRICHGQGVVYLLEHQFSDQAAE